MHPEIARAFLSLAGRPTVTAAGAGATRPLVLTWLGRWVLLRLVPA
jgi:hypothetical protein